MLLKTLVNTTMSGYNQGQMYVEASNYVFSLLKIDK